MQIRNCKKHHLSSGYDYAKRFVQSPFSFKSTEVPFRVSFAPNFNTFTV